jgi:phosphatidylinositol glycan class B
VGGSEIFGIDSFWMYITRSIPLLFLTWLPFLLLGITVGLARPEIRTQCAYLLFIIGVPFFFFSHHAHKEDRFMTILVPYFSIFTAIGLDKYLEVAKNYQKLTRICIFIIIFSNLMLFSYSSFVDRSGAIKSMDYIREHRDEINSLAVLTRCHSTPYSSFIHK